jgi:hypothetical protein
MQVGHFEGREVYAASGRYLGECGSGEDANRLLTNQHKKQVVHTGFVPTLVHPRTPARKRAPLPLYSGHEDFPPASNFMQRAMARAWGTS